VSLASVREWFAWHGRTVAVLALALGTGIWTGVASVARAPHVTIAVLVDTSGSVAQDLPAFKGTAQSLLDDMREGDGFVLIEVYHQVVRHNDASGLIDRGVPRSQIRKRLEELHIQPGRGTDLAGGLEEAERAVSDLAGFVPDRFVVAVFTDGANQFSSQWQPPTYIHDRKAKVYAIGNRFVGNDSFVEALRGAHCIYQEYQPGQEADALNDMRQHVAQLRGGKTAQPGGVWAYLVDHVGGWPLGVLSGLAVLVVACVLANVAALWVWPMPGYLEDPENDKWYALGARHGWEDFLLPRGRVVIAVEQEGSPRRRADIHLQVADESRMVPSRVAIRRGTPYRYRLVLTPLEGAAPMLGENPVYVATDLAPAARTYDDWLDKTEGQDLVVGGIKDTVEGVPLRFEPEE